MKSSMRRRFAAAALLLMLPGCASRPAPPPAIVMPQAPPVAEVPLDRRVGRVLRLEDERRLDDGAGANLLNLLTDENALVRRRAALAVGRVGLEAGVAALVGALADRDADVRASAAFAIGLIGARSGVEPLIRALGDEAWSVRGRAAEGLGLIADTQRTAGRADPAADKIAADAIATMAAGCRTVIAPLASDDEKWPWPHDVDACRSALLALVRLKQFDALARVVLDETGQPVSRWWPVAFSLQRVGDKRAVPALLALLTSEGVNTPAFALRGLGGYGDRQGLPAAKQIIARRNANVRLRVAAARMIGQLKDVASIPDLLRVLDDEATPRNLSLELVAALAAIGDPSAFNPLADLFGDRWAPMRAATLTAAAKVDPEAFLLIVSGSLADKDWTVRAALAGILGGLDPDRVRGVLIELASEADPRVQAAALTALATAGAPDLDARLAAALEAADFNLRATAAELIGKRKPAGAAERLIKAYARGQSDANESARGAAIAALATLGAEAAVPTLREALADRDWSIRLQAAALLRTLGQPDADARRPAPSRFPPEYFESDALLRPVYSPHAFIETRFGTIELELNVVEAPLATQSFVSLARKNFFNGMRIHRVVPNFVVQAGDDRGDGAGGPGYTLRDELSPIPFRRGTVGMALGGKDTGGSQFFITASPQPHLDGRYAVIGEVVRGIEFLDLITQWDVIERIRIWDGVRF